MAMYLHRVGAESAPARFTWQPRDCSLYALAVGAGLDDVAFTTEGNIGVAQAVYPSFAFAAVASLADEWPDPCFDTGDFALEQAVLGEQDLRVYRPIEPSGDVAIRTRVAGIHDKGSGALLVLDQDAVDTVTGDAVFTSTVGMFIMGEGGFGGDRSSAPSRPPLPTGAPDHVVNATAPPIQTLLYRHAGNDSNPVHLDAEFARRAGWDGPILTGQNLLGFACRALVQAVLDGDPARLRSVGGRFARPAYNGDALVTEIWVDTEPVDTVERTARFRVVNRDGTVLVDRGHCSFA